MKVEGIRSRWWPYLALTAAGGGLLLLVVFGPVVYALSLRPQAVDQAGAAVVVLMAGVALCPLSLALVAVALAGWGVHRVRRRMPPALRTWQVRMARLEARSRDLGFKAAAPLIRGYAVAAAFRHLVARGAQAIRRTDHRRLTADR